MKRLFPLCFLCLFALPVVAQEEKKAEEPVEFTSMRDVIADPALMSDFAVQGEYMAKKADGSILMGLQLIADGGGKFRAVSYPGGLPGEGWDATKPALLGSAAFDKEKGEIAFEMNKGIGKDKDGKEIEMPEAIKEVGKFEAVRGEATSGENRRGPRGAKIVVAANGDRPQMVFEKMFRRSSTLGMKAPDGAYVVFDGANVDNFEPGAKMNETPRGNTLWSEATSKPFPKDKSYTMHIEFMLSYMPTKHGQARSNSGVYVNESYECQVLDSFGHVPPQNNECGGFYQVAAPKVNMCFPPLTWQTYDIDFTPPKFENGKKTANAKITVKHNGVVIHESIEPQKETPGRKGEADEARGVYFQGHGNKVQYRNIWVQYK